MHVIEVVHWNPARSVWPGRVGRYVPYPRRRVNNFGDLLGPVIVAKLVEELGLAEPSSDKRLLAVGSILRLARTGDTLWGVGANGKSLTESYEFGALDIRAVRGPLTRNFLISMGHAVPEIFGDPGLLVGKLWSRDILAEGHPARRVTIVPNMHDLADLRRAARADEVVDPTESLWDVIGAIAASDLVVGSSLHAIVVAESLGIPARLVASRTEPRFKYEDYYQGTGRTTFVAAATVRDAIEMGGEPTPTWDATPLVHAFPRDLWLDPDGSRRESA